MTRRAGEARKALENVLCDSDGAWLLAPQCRGGSELAITTWSQSRGVASPAARPTSVRVDRIFHAGAEPHTPGNDFLWIVDYKTTDHGPAGLEDFLANQRATYGPQLETYARILAPVRSVPHEQVRLALYFPTLPRLVWWKPALTQTEN